MITTSTKIKYQGQNPKGLMSIYLNQCIVFYLAFYENRKFISMTKNLFDEHNITAALCK